jgi:murein L,D-transpeptidase YcbB/YkuD
LRREKNSPAATRIDAGPVLKVGMKDPRVPLIRAHFKIGGAETTTSDDLLYDTRVASEVKNFQRENGLPASGQLTARTVAVLSGGHPSALEDEIIINMERLRWLPHEAAADRIEVNIPDYTVRVYHDNQVIHQARVIVGKPTTPTPVFSNAMKFLEVNPYWNVPDSIIKKEMLPKLAADPTYLARMGYEVKTVRGRLVVRQPPGDRNALGHIKFMFPNQHAVYLHDTPTRGLFKTDRRAYSHGCVRVDNPFKLAEIVLGKDNGWTEARVEKLIGKGNRTIHLPKPLDIDIGYFTAFVDDGGKLQLRDDIYGYSRKLKTALGLEG